MNRDASMVVDGRTGGRLVYYGIGDEAGGDLEDVPLVEPSATAIGGGSFEVLIGRGSAGAWVFGVIRIGEGSSVCRMSYYLARQVAGRGADRAV